MKMRPLSAQETTELREATRNWLKKSFHWPPSDDELVKWSAVCLRFPELMDDLFALGDKPLKQFLLAYYIVVRKPKKFSPRDVAAKIDQLLESNPRLELGEARQIVEDLSRLVGQPKTTGAVKGAHVTFGKHKKVTRGAPKRKK